MRPTQDPKRNRIEVRINDETKALLAGKAHGRGLSDVVRECLEEYFSEEKIDSFVVQNTKNVVHNPQTTQNTEKIKKFAVLTEMVNISGGDIDSFLSEITALVENGDIRLENGHISEAYVGLDMTGFLNACSESGKDPQSVLDYIAMNIWRL